MNDDTRLGPMATITGRDEVAEQFDDAVAKGAVVHLGGQVPDRDGAFYPATVLSGVSPDMRAYHEEPFGPVAVLHRVDSVEAAIEMANDLPIGGVRNSGIGPELDRYGLDEFANKKLVASPEPTARFTP